MNDQPPTDTKFPQTRIERSISAAQQGDADALTPEQRAIWGQLIGQPFVR